MTKLHFIALADALRNSKAKRVECTSTQEYEAILLWQTETINAIADACQASNSRFDRWLWLAYIAGECGPSGGKIK